MAWWASLLSSVLGDSMNKKNPEIKDVQKKEGSVLSQPSGLQNTSGGGGGFMGALSGMASGSKDGGDSSNGWKLDPKTNMWVRG